MLRRGFLGALGAALVAPFLPRLPKTEGALFGYVFKPFGRDDQFDQISSVAWRARDTEGNGYGQFMLLNDNNQSTIDIAREWLRQDARKALRDMRRQGKDFVPLAQWNTEGRYQVL